MFSDVNAGTILENIRLGMVMFWSKSAPCRDALLLSAYQRDLCRTPRRYSWKYISFGDSEAPSNRDDTRGRVRYESAR